MPMDRSRYPDDWVKIAHRVKDAARWVCQACGAPHGDDGAIDLDGCWNDREEIVEMPVDLQRQLFGPDGPELRRSILTVAHLNHEPEDCSDDNLRALCAACHRAYDRDDNAIRAARTLKRRHIEGLAAAGQTFLSPEFAHEATEGFAPRPLVAESPESPGGAAP